MSSGVRGVFEKLRQRFFCLCTLFALYPTGKLHTRISGGVAWNSTPLSASAFEIPAVGELLMLPDQPLKLKFNDSRMWFQVCSTVRSQSHQ